MLVNFKNVWMIARNVQMELHVIFVNMDLLLPVESAVNVPQATVSNVILLISPNVLDAQENIPYKMVNVLTLASSIVSNVNLATPLNAPNVFKVSPLATMENV